MILLQASHIEKHYESNEVLIDASLVLQDRDRIALLGPNGAGKSTLLRIAVGQERPDGGSVSLAKQATLGYVAQFLDMDENTTLFNFVAESFRALIDMEQQLVGLEHQMAQPDVYEDEARFQQVASTYDNLRQQFTDANGYAVEARIRRVLDGLAFPAEVWHNPVKSLSGGQKTRLSLARLLAQEPDILVLDEPTNYLDTETLSWLENYLKTYNGAILVVSHDRYFLDAICTAVYELAAGRTTRYEGNYSAYIDQKAEQLELETKRFESQQEQIQKMEEFVQKNLARASTTKRAQSRRKALERMVRMDKPDSSVPRLAAQFTAARSTGRDVLQTKQLAAGYDGVPLCSDVDLHLRKGDRVAIIGQNGIGKTTLLKTLIGRLVPVEGSLRWGTNVDMGFYDQEQQDLNPTKTVLSQIHDEFPKLSLTAVRTALGRFLFRGADVEKPVASLSGGERSRVALCRLMLRQPNVLIMDEPTNHLDLLAKEALEEALSDYDGTLLFVSHDRYFIDALATHILRLDADGHRLYLGNYTDYLHKRADDEQWEHDWQNQADTPDKTTSGAKSSMASSGQEPGTELLPTEPQSPAERGQAHGTPMRQGLPLRQGPDSALATTASEATQVASDRAPSGTGGNAAPSPRPVAVRSADLRKLTERVEKLERLIEETEAAQEQASAALIDASMNAKVDEIQRLQELLATLSAQHQEQLDEWEQAAAKLEELKQLDWEYRNRT